ncbi:hypothetical protein [Candidatus Enterovibrio escicola]|uniref:hypothetical protein n=1 Tax=Candidatus Enterovibrio escicola TaxID=1927127 RepID=UPI0012382315
MTKPASIGVTKGKYVKKSIYHSDSPIKMKESTITEESPQFTEVLQSGRVLVELCYNSVSASEFANRAIGNFDIDRRSALLIYQTIKFINISSLQKDTNYIRAYREGFLAYNKYEHYTNPYPEDGVSNSYNMCVHERGGNCLENLAFENGYFDAKEISKED